MLLKTHKLQLSSLLSEHIGPCIYDGSQLKTQHFHSLRKMETGYPSDHGKGYAPFPSLMQTGSKSHKQPCAQPCEGPPGGRTNTAALVLPGTGVLLHRKWIQSFQLAEVKKEHTRFYTRQRFCLQVSFWVRKGTKFSLTHISATKLIVWHGRATPGRRAGEWDALDPNISRKHHSSFPPSAGRHEQPRALHTGSQALDSPYLQRVSWILWPV